MKFIFICLILIHQHQDTQCFTGLDLVLMGINNFGAFISNTMRHIRETLTHLLISPMYHNKPYEYPNNRFIGRRKDKEVYRMMSATTSREFETHNAEYARLKLEPTALMSAVDLIKLHGKTAEIHTVKTKDGYFLKIHRIMLHDKLKSNNRTVLLHHGLLGSSADWVMLGPNKSLPYLLSDAGYDVWLANARGNQYSKEHEKLSVSSVEFWNFTWQEMGQYDLPAVIDYIRKEKYNSEKISYIGHSMGATALLVMLSTTPNYTEYLRMGVLLAPLALMTDVKGPLRILSAIQLKPPEIIFDILGYGELFPQKRLPAIFIKKFCKRAKLFCSNPLFFFTGSVHTIGQNKDKGFLARLLYHVPAGGSTRTILHYVQIIRTGKFHAYNNIEKEFNLTNITLPLALFSSNDDGVAIVSDVTRLFVNLVNPIEHVTLKDKNISHSEFVWGTDANSLVFSKIIKILDYNPNNEKKRNEI